MINMLQLYVLQSVIHRVSVIGPNRTRILMTNSQAVNLSAASFSFSRWCILSAMNKTFHMQSPFEPAGDQPNAIKQLVEGLEEGLHAQTLLGVTGSGKTFTIANVIAQTQRPALVMAPNKTLAAQLYGEFAEFFPDNAVEYFVSYYDY